MKEAYRHVTVREGDKVMSLPAIQAVLRSQVALAVRGNGPAQRAMIAAIHVLEQELATEAAAQEKAAAAQPPMSYTDAARRISFLLRLAEDEKAEQQAGNPDGARAGLLGHDPSGAGK